MERYAFYQGCAIWGHQPFVDAAAKKTGALLGVELLDIAGATCCPDPEITRNVAYDLWLTLAARNLALAEKIQDTKGVVIVCNGCWSTFEKSTHALDDEAKRKGVNVQLKNFDLEYTGKIKPVNIIEVLHNHLDDIRARQVVSMDGLKAVVQYGCRIQNDKHLVSMFDEVVEALGVEIVRYPAERVCCGLPLMYYDENYAFKERSFRKLKQIGEAAPDFICGACTACYDQIEKAVMKLKTEEGVDVKIPSIFPVELVAIALGIKPSEFGLKYHRVKPKELMDKLGLKI